MLAHVQWKTFCLCQHVLLVSHFLYALIGLQPYLCNLHELRDLGHTGQELLVDLKGLLAVRLLHFEIFFYKKARTI